MTTINVKQAASMMKSLFDKWELPCLYSDGRWVYINEYYTQEYLRDNGVVEVVNDG